eukprot:2224422-Rhodomonas_salina.1
MYSERDARAGIMMIVGLTGAVVHDVARTRDQQSPSTLRLTRNTSHVGAFRVRAACHCCPSIMVLVLRSVVSSKSACAMNARRLIQADARELRLAFLALHHDAVWRRQTLPRWI